MVINDMKVYFCRSGVLSVLFCAILGATSGSNEKTLEEIERDIDEANKSNESLVRQSGSSLNEESIDIGRAVHEYKYEESEDALILLSKHMRPDSDTVYTATVLGQIKMTSDTLDLLLDYASKSGSQERSIALQRLSRAPLTLEIDRETQNRIRSIFKRYINNHDQSNLKLRVQASIANQDYLRNLEISESSTQHHNQFSNDLSQRSHYASGSTLTIDFSKTSEVVETVQEVTPPEPLSEEPVGMVASEPAAESNNKFSNWRLWFIGVAMVVVGFAAAVFRVIKKRGSH